MLHPFGSSLVGRETIWQGRLPDCHPLLIKGFPLFYLGDLFGVDWVLCCAVAFRCSWLAPREPQVSQLGAVLGNSQLTIRWFKDYPSSGPSWM